jgi:hypothetical protein
MYPGGRVKGQDDEREPSHHLSAQLTVDDVEYEERDGKGHEVVAEQILFEDKPQTNGCGDERDQRDRFQ